MKSFKGYINKTIYRVQLTQNMKDKEVQTYLDDLVDVVITEMQDKSILITVAKGDDED